jgi:streptogramin lyase
MKRLLQVCTALCALSFIHSSWAVYGLPQGGGTVGVVRGPGRQAMWFSGIRGTAYNVLDRVEFQGRTTPFSLASWEPSSLAVGADGRLYMTSVCCSGSNGPAVLAISSTGRTFPSFLPGSGNDDPNDGVVLGRDGNIWFTTNTSISNVTPKGVINQFSLPAGFDVEPGITATPDGKIWFPLNVGGSFLYGGLGSIDPITHAKAALGFPQCYYVEPLVAGLGGNLYAGCQTSPSGPVSIAQITPTGQLTLITDSLGVRFAGGSVMVATRGKVWFISWDREDLSELNTTDLTVQQHPAPRALGQLGAIGLGPAGELVAGSSDQPKYGIFSP